MGLVEILLSSMARAPWGWTLLGVVIVALIKTWPILHLQIVNAQAQLRGERRDELHDCTRRLDEVNNKVNALNSRVHQLDIKLVGTVTAYRVLHDHMNTTDPDHDVLHQARTIFRATWDGTIDTSALMVNDR